MFQPGKSGNPSGRPAVVRQEFIAKLKKAGLIDKAVKTLVTAMEGKDRVEVAKYILDHVYGKAPQAVDMTSNGETMSAYFAVPKEGLFDGSKKSDRDRPGETIPGNAKKS